VTDSKGSYGRPSVRRRWIARLSVTIVVAAAVLFLLAEGCVAAPAHDVHSPGAISLNLQIAKTDLTRPAMYFGPIAPRESLDSIRCELWRSLHSETPTCPDGAALATSFFPDLTQHTKTLYFVWQRCAGTSGVYGEYSVASGFNAEYRPSDRTLVIHCFSSASWISLGPMVHGTAAMPPPPSLAAVSTESFGPGTIRIIEDDRLEHLVGDQSTEFQVATATIS
jgi:hypothetical protein